MKKKNYEILFRRELDLLLASCIGDDNVVRQPTKQRFESAVKLLDEYTKHREKTDKVLIEEPILLN